MDLVVGRVVKAHGITGEVVVDVRTDDPWGRFAAGTSLRARARDKTERTYVVSSMREHGARLLVRLDGVESRDAADALRGGLFIVDTAELPAIDDPDEFYDHQLEGLRVRTVTGRDVGTPILHFVPPDGAAFFGPVISRLPGADEAEELWEHVVALARFPGFAGVPVRPDRQRDVPVDEGSALIRRWPGPLSRGHPPRRPGLVQVAGSGLGPEQPRPGLALVGVGAGEPALGRARCISRCRRRELRGDRRCAIDVRARARGG